MAAKPILIAALLVASAASAPAAVAGPAGAVPLTCGMTVTTDAYLAHDLTCATATGVTLDGAVTLDLRGHRLIGPGATTSSVAVSVSGSGGEARVLHGKITRWSVGVSTDFGAGPVAISRVQFALDDIGVSASGATVTVVGSRFSDVRYGVSTLFAQLQVSRSVLSGDGVDGSGTGVLAYESRANVDLSVIRNFHQGAFCDNGILFINRSALLGNDTAVGNFLCGPRLRDDLVLGNRVGIEAGNAFGESVQAAGVVFTGNRTGVVAGVGGVADVQDSVFAGNRVGVGVPVGDEAFPPSVILKRDVFRHNGDGVLVVAPQSQAQLGDNLAYRNAGWGLYVAGTVVDLGGNVAYGNGEPAQCYGVVCAPRR